MKIFILFFGLITTATAFAAEDDCGLDHVRVVYQSSVDYELACDAIQQISQLVQKEFGYRTEAPVLIEFKDTVYFSLLDNQGAITSQEKVYGLYYRTENRIEMSAFASDIVQNLDRAHFSLKIRTMPVSETVKNQLLLEMHRSVVIHELTHLYTQFNFIHHNPSPALYEYFSYVIQLKSLSPQLLEEILNLNPQVFTHDLQINSLIHYSDPHKFGVMAYRHFENLGPRKKIFIEEALSGSFRPDDLLEML